MAKAKKGTKTGGCSYCGTGLSRFICAACAAAGIDGPVRGVDVGRKTPLTPVERAVLREVVRMELLSAGEARMLSRYLRGPRNCNRFDALPDAVQVAARRFTVRFQVRLDHAKRCGCEYE